MNKIKMTSADDNSGSVVVAFMEKWKQPLLDDTIKVYFRKRGPVLTPDYVYIYIARPTSAIIGRVRVVLHGRYPLSEALDRSEDGGISREELGNYARGCLELSVTYFDGIQPFKQPLGLQQLKSKFLCLPPQNFFFLSDVGKAELDKFAQL